MAHPFSIEMSISVDAKDVLYTLKVLVHKEVKFFNNRLYFISSRYERSELTRRGIPYTIGGIVSYKSA